MAPHWPEPWGLGADPELQLIVDDELDQAGVSRPDSPIAIGWAGPTIVAGGTPTQQKRWLPGILDGSTEWCQLFSEPEAGSDLASLRTRAENDGWKLAKVTLANERVSLSEGGVLWGMGPDPDECFAEIRARGAGSDPVTRQRSARLRSETKVIELLSDKIIDAMMTGADPGPVASIRKALADVHGQDLMALVKDLSGPGGMIGLQDSEAEELDPWHWGYLFSRALTIGGGTSEVQRNIIGERLLGLPREPTNEG